MSVFILLTILFAVAGTYFAFRCFSLKRALWEVDRDLSEIRQNLSRNQILHLPLPDHDLERLIQSINDTLEEIRQERLSYEKREAEFQKLIENISHDLRTPLTVILGYLKWMQKGDSTLGTVFPDAPEQNPPAGSPVTPEQEASSASPDILQQNVHVNSPGISSQNALADSPGILEQNSFADFLNILERNARTMEKLVSQFYDFSRLNARDYALELQDVDVCRILRESIVTHYQLIEDAHLSLNCHLPKHPVIICGNTNALERIFSNLFQNIGRYARSFLDIRLEEADHGQVDIFFQNDSEPITGDELSHFFDRFYKNDSSRRQQGSGLGLTVAKSLAELMGGTLTAALVRPEASETESDPTVICFTLTMNSGS